MHIYHSTKVCPRPFVYKNKKIWDIKNDTIVNSLIQIAAQVAQSILLGNLAGYFAIEEPTAEDTRNAYLYALGKLLYM